MVQSFLMWYVKYNLFVYCYIFYMKEGGYAGVIFYEPNDMMTFAAVPSNQLPALLKVKNKFELRLVHL